MAGAGVIRGSTEVLGWLVLSSFSYDLLVFLRPYGLSSSSCASHMVAELTEVSIPKRRKRKLPVLLKSTSKMYATYTHCVPCVSMSHRPASVWGGPHRVHRPHKYREVCSLGPSLETSYHSVGSECCNKNLKPMAFSLGQFGGRS